MALASPEKPTDFLKSVRLGLTGSYYKMAHALGLRRLQDLLSVRSLLLLLHHSTGLAHKLSKSHVLLSGLSRAAGVLTASLHTGPTL